MYFKQDRTGSSHSTLHALCYDPANVFELRAFFCKFVITILAEVFLRNPHGKAGNEES